MKAKAVQSGAGLESSAAIWSGAMKWTGVETSSGAVMSSAGSGTSAMLGTSSSVGSSAETGNGATSPDLHRELEWQRDSPWRGLLPRAGDRCCGDVIGRINYVGLPQDGAAHCGAGGFSQVVRNHGAVMAIKSLVASKVSSVDGRSTSPTTWLGES